MKRKKRFHVIAGKGRKKKAGDTFVHTLLLLAVGLLVLQATYYLARNALAGMLVKTVISEDSVLEQVITANGVIVRNEHVVAAPATGVIRWSATGGNRVAVGADLGTIHAENGSIQVLKAPVPGVFIQELDGLEGELQPNALAGIDVAQIKKMPGKQYVVADGKEVKQGSMLYKIVNNYDWYFVAELSAKDVAALGERKSSRLRFAFSPDEEVWAAWSVVAENEDSMLVAFTLQEDVDGCFSQRLADADIIVRRITGLVLPSSALVLRGEEAGVYVIDKSVVRYIPVSVVETAGETIVVEGVRAGFTVITNPLLVREGQRL